MVSRNFWECFGMEEWYEDREDSGECPETGGFETNRDPEWDKRKWRRDRK